jgi:hypothetical protein
MPLVFEGAVSLKEERKGDAAVSLDKLGALECAPYGPRGLPCPCAAENEGRLMDPPRRLLFEPEPELLPLRTCPPILPPLPVWLSLPPAPIGTAATLKDVRYGPADIAPLALGGYAELGLD